MSFTLPIDLFGIPLLLLGDSILSIPLSTLPVPLFSTYLNKLSQSRLSHSLRTLPYLRCSLIYKFLFMFNLVTPNDNRSIFFTAISNSTSCLLCQRYCLQAIQYRWLTLLPYCRLSLSFLQVLLTNHSCHRSPATPPCLHS